MCSCTPLTAVHYCQCTDYPPDDISGIFNHPTAVFPFVALSVRPVRCLYFYKC